ncbi:2-oxoacid:ferredoxin oxidoreductase, alpha subunit [Desulfosporosinus orientis DSM 765]|uniref:2-oxoacid:ferredoxin oxidoreductase, alpha subunit n=1 Tax=Desulfosporosinus orientis (strain ATCC 19365 / DSM 765 / NCIMB 8382 / VKM B-1628 / Singapore I) TaxID=768706 RepID=G7WC22_DESOD|nr:transketolase C-terminal domain-containing protein [Desulfosporosinus orientis]AET69996.1 2-oxoacid:ferredoxin oxidoreductase, alpha subunit [Desulfosporosinus orientis DSM 765]
MSTTLLTGSEAAAYGAKLARIEVLAYYPITPAFPAMERISKFIDEGDLNTRFVRVESDHSALAAALGASLAGSRTFTVTNSQGLLYMTEVVYHTAGLRQPVVMAVANRALSAPHSRFPEQGDAISQGASGWIQLFCENNQEVLDTTLQAFKIAETVRLPVMVNYEGYIQSHTMEEVGIPGQEKIDQFLPLKRVRTLDVENPQAVNTVASPEFYMDYKFRQNEAMDQALTVIDSVASDFAQEFGRDWFGLIDTYQMDDAEHAIVAMGSMVSDARIVVDELRNEGRKIGLVKIRTWRPFPAEALRKVLEKVQLITVFDKNIVYGLGGALGTELRSALYGQSARLNSYILGLGGRDVTTEEIKKVLELSEKTEKQAAASEWFGL